MVEGVLVKVLPLLPFSKTFDYICFLDASEGDLVSLEFGKIQTFGVVMEVAQMPEVMGFELKEIKNIVLKNLFTEKLLKFIKAASKYHCGSVGMFLRLSFPFSKFYIPEVKEEIFTKLSPNALPTSLKSKLWYTIWEELKDGACKEISSIKLPFKEFEKMKEKSLLEGAAKPLPAAIKSKLAQLSPEQQHAFEELKKGLSQGFKTFLLEGETGSGKTEVYFHLINEVIKTGGQVLLMLPEIALSSAILERFHQRFGFEAKIWHSSIYEKKKIENYLEIINGDAKVIIGTRSALFLPFKNLKLVIADEEHDTSYKQEENTIYHGRDMAVMRGFMFNFLVVLGSATPSVESINNVRNGKYALVKLQNRFFVNQMPVVTIVDMRVAKPERNEFISPVLKEAAMSAIKNSGQALFFLNRRGYAPVVLCGECGVKIKCKFCDVNLTEHRIEGKLKCHHCGYIREKPSDCEACGGSDCMRVFGAGVERIKEELCKILPEEEVVLLTSDTFSSPQKTKEALEKIESGKAKMIVGTQVISKGYHFPNLKFVGILDADFGLNIEDFRAFERTFQLLYQVAGRTGREKADGQVFIQTYEPKNKVLFSIVNYDKENFYSIELESREKFKLPPFAKQVAFVVSGIEREQTLDYAKKLALVLEEEFGKLYGFSIFGPTVPIISYLRGKFRFRILILSIKEFALQERLQKILEKFKSKKQLSIKVDVDPLTFY